jgi:hypothetical protein
MPLSYDHLNRDFSSKKVVNKFLEKSFFRVNFIFNVASKLVSKEFDGFEALELLNLLIFKTNGMVET